MLADALALALWAFSETSRTRMILFQDTALVYIIGLADFFRTASNIGKTTGNEIDMVLFAGAGYFVVCFCVSVTVTMKLIGG